MSLELGFASDDFGYLVDLGLPQMAGHRSLFAFDPEIKREAVFVGPVMRTGSTLVRRTRDYAEASAESGRGFDELTRSLPAYRSVLEETSLHPALVRPLASLIQSAASQTQVVVVTHSRAMLEFLNTMPVADAENDGDAVEIELSKELGETLVAGLGLLTTPPWDWGKR